MDFGQQIGPLPLGAWIAVVGGGLGIAWYTRSQGDKTPVQVESGAGDAGVGAGASSYTPVSGWTNAGSTPADPVAGPETNEAWARLAINYLISQGIDPSGADTAIRKYLESTALSNTEKSYVDIALKKFGSPPVPLPIPPPLPTIPPPTSNPTPPPAPKPQPAPVRLRYVIVTPWRSQDSTLSGMAQHYYGRADRWREIYAANRKGITRPDGSPGFISNPNYLRPGDRVYVP